jgi:hypothetical protein
MKIKLLLIILFIGFLSTCFAQKDSTWNKFNWLIGEWFGVGSGQPGEGSGTFSFNLDLDKNILVRKSHSEYPATAKKPKIIHDDLMIVYPASNGSSFKANYFDNESHVINYIITFTHNSIILLSDKTTDAPVFRLTYTLLEKNIVGTKFEMSKDGQVFTTYIEGKSKKKE